MAESPTTSPPRLSSLAVSAGTLVPPFMPGRTEYALLVDHATETVRISAEVESGRAHWSVKGRRLGIGETSPPVPLECGRNSIELTARNGHEDATTYRIWVLRGHPVPDWTREGETAPWPARDSAGELVFQDHLWLFGGYTPDVINDVWRSPDGVSWEPTGRIPCESGVNIPIRFVHQDRMWVASQRGALFSSVDGRSWNLATDRAPWAGRKTAGSAVFKGRMWVLGGLHGGQRHNDVWSSADGVEWRQETEEAAWSRRQLWDNVVVFDEHLWIIGGGYQGYHPFKPYGDVWRSPDGKHWERVTDEAPWLPRIWNSCAVYRNRLWMFGGFRSEPVWTNFNDVWYSSDGADWRRLETSSVWSPRHEVSPYVFLDKLWVIGGNAWPLMNDAWSLRIGGLTFLTQPVVEEFVGALYTYRARADLHGDRGPLRYRLLEAPAWLSIDERRGVVRGTPPTVGAFRVVIAAASSDGERATQDYQLHVRA